MTTYLVVGYFNNRISRARKLLLDGDIDSGDYKTIKSDSEYKINVLEAKFAEVASVNVRSTNIEPLMERSAN